MQKYLYPERETWKDIAQRPHFEREDLEATVKVILNDIKRFGDKALFELEAKFDNVKLDALKVKEEEFMQAIEQISDSLKKSIDTAADNIFKFHKSQEFETKEVETSPGVFCWQKSIAIEKVGLYVPGGTAPLFSTVLMLAIPAGIAGCEKIILCSPPDKDGMIHPAILYAAHISGVTDVFKLGGVQAIGAMAYGTESVDKVYKIFGPGNQFVTKAKQIVSVNDVAIDMPAGPSEVLIIADSTSHEEFAASDFLSQAEHGRDSQSVLVTTDEDFAVRFEFALLRQLENLSRKEFATLSLGNSKIVVLKDDKEVMDFTNEYAPEHLIIETQNCDDLALKVINAGSVFIGNYTPESAGDYASGTNHTLPTSGFAKAYSGVNLDSFNRKVTFQKITKEGLRQLGPVIEEMAMTEQLDAHKNAVTIRLNELTLGES